MPIKKRDELTWQFDLLRLLPTDPPGASYEEIYAELQDLGFDKTLRTVQRTLPALVDLGLVCDTSDKVHRWRWPAHFRGIERYVMPTAEAVSLRLIEQIVSPLLPESLRVTLDDRFDKARIKLDSLRRMNNRRIDWGEKIAAIPGNFTLRPPAIAPEILQTVQEALLDDSELNVDYQSLEDPHPRARRLHPRALIQSGSVTYLVATRPDSAEDPDEPIQYRLDRIHKAITTNRRVSRSSFDLKQYLADDKDKVGTREIIHLELWVSDRLAKILKATAISDDQQLTAAGNGAIVTATVRNTLRLQQWLLGHHENVEVRKPAILRRWMVKKLTDALARYR
jgi:predicted DNA-binding transcriptional regulator YafY